MSVPAAGPYDDTVAALYDTWFGEWPGIESTIGRLAELAADGPVLELGIGTGRIALPLLEHGVDVRGIDASAQMLAQLRAKPGGNRIPVTLGDFSFAGGGGEFALVYVVAGTFFELPTQEAQLRCFASVARRLRPGGVFVLDGLVPDGTRLLAQQGRVILARDGQEVLQFRQYDPAEQRVVSHYLITSPEGTRHLRVSFRYAQPAELDLMARLAGLRLRERWGTWDGAPFTAASTYHVSLYDAAG